MILQDTPSLPILAVALRFDLIAKLGLAVLLGGIIGIEREVSGKPAGLRTNILICIGSAILTDLSISLSTGVDGASIGDPGRLAAQIVSGIGFLGAGTIMQARGAVLGLTTAATIWVVAAIGMTVGAGRYLEACLTAMAVWLVLVGLGAVEKRLLRARRVVTGTIRMRPQSAFDEVEETLRTGGIRVTSKAVFDHPDDRTFEVKLTGPARQYDIVSDVLMQRHDVISVQFD